MGIRQRILLVFLVFGCLPALLLSCVLYGVNRQRSVARFDRSLERQTKERAARIRGELVRREQLLRVLGSSSQLQDAASHERSTELSGAAQPIPTPLVEQLENFDTATGGDLRALYCFGGDHLPLFRGDVSANSERRLKLDTGTSMGSIPIALAAWDQPPDGPFLSNPIRDGGVRYYLPLRLAGARRGMLVLDFGLAQLLENELATVPREAGSYQVVLDSEGRILHHTGGASRFQLAAEAIPALA
ncbi:MAG: hypothetical protein ABIP75_12075, partial [Pyrinomonadaceae bacterium]